MEKQQATQDATLWQAVLGEIELSVSRGNFLTWFKQTKLLKQTDDSFIVGVPNIFVKNQLERKFITLISETLKKQGVDPGNIQFKILASTGISNKGIENELLKNPENFTPKPVRRNSDKTPIADVTHDYRQGLNEKYTFETFVVGGSNELAYAACQAVAQNPGRKYNPLFLYGGVGIGKTHLLQAVGHSIIEKNPNAKIVYASTEQFVQEFVDSIRFKRNTDFAKRYRSADVLIVDDVQFLAGKEKIQEEFFHTFNALHQANKQILMTSDKPPRDIPTLEERLRSRFAWGMTIDMQTPDFETRVAILQNKAHTQQIELTSEIAEYLATRIQSNIRELEGTLNQLLAFCEMRGVEPSIELAKSIFESSKSRPKHISAKQIIEKTAKHFQVSMEDILGPKRDKDIVMPRQVAMYILRSELHLSFPKIAHELGRKDHTTAIHSIEKIEKELTIDGPIKQYVTEIRERLYV